MLAYVRYGSASLAWLFKPLPSMGGSAAMFPAGFGFSLWATYLVWVADTSEPSAVPRRRVER